MDQAFEKAFYFLVNLRHTRFYLGNMGPCRLIELIRKLDSVSVRGGGGNPAFAGGVSGVAIEVYGLGGVNGGAIPGQLGAVKPGQGDGSFDA
jgi:hypothetical protein